MPIWIISLNLPKAFDRVHWPSLWRALSQQGINDRMIGLLQICTPIREGKLPEPTRKAAGYLTLNGAGEKDLHWVLDYSVPYWKSVWDAMGMWRRMVGKLGLDLGDGGPTLLDVRFANDSLIFATTYNHIHGRRPAFPGRARIEQRPNQGDDYRGSTATISVNPNWLKNRNFGSKIMS